ncbi:MAG: hypothetical protein KDA85_13165 [Planctomycetaceae bacterium]|nr:hypothetical protein [Planctomycetaceae bacterium]
MPVCRFRQSPPRKLLSLLPRIVQALLFFFATGTAPHVMAQNPAWTLANNPELEAYFAEQTAAIEQENSLLNYRSLQEWEAARPRLREQLFEMLGLYPLPDRTELHATVTGTVTQDDVVVEKLHFQSMPGLYVTANLYRPVRQDGPLPAVLYVCGHGGVKKDGVSLGNKTHYQHHGAWFARNGYVCLIIDTL